MNQHDAVVEVWTGVNQQIFKESIYPRRCPAIIRGLDIGSCIKKWTPDYLAQAGGDRDVKVHVAPTPKMDFINKNFAYRSLPFKEYVSRASKEKQINYFFQEDEKYYLRSLGDDPRRDIADVRKDFPALAYDIEFPPFFEENRFFSSVFRIASKGVQLWTHYDVMDNLLIQVNGRKKVVLFSPRDATHLYLNGDKSEVLDIDNPDLNKFPNFKSAVRHECVLEPGDILFIPALWFHNVITLDFGIAVNVFWRHLEDNLYDSKDTYGNKDLNAATRAMQVMDRALKILDELPEEYRDFYARRMVSKIQAKAYMKEFDKHVPVQETNVLNS